MSKLNVPRRSVMIGGAALALSPAAAFASSSPDIGKPAPQFSAIDSNGKTWSLADLKGKVVVLETTNHDCPTCASTTRRTTCRTSNARPPPRAWSG